MLWLCSWDRNVSVVAVTVGSVGCRYILINARLSDEFWRDGSWKTLISSCMTDTNYKAGSVPRGVPMLTLESECSG
ncbi:uncharacterized protein G2W53_036900 [Senna tora]|uniref:Uncharacterized protein n=1 Tax=Senna tora TaxID=362788 RepID=A0A834W5J2_9FABA|nr:uncharacterized protein G2W53_036900 [Senna tora]